ncbi:MAG: hypothetical protein CO108_03475 [Deltaproteobacteria bacterium CG_4_9_14_3_um_filter_63_12]|nr:MAG: hypothetical protein CO108_03475 [Deltaproteobacteria bacterium CG_4_9_14_3_um_filter_63_12]
MCYQGCVPGMCETMCGANEICGTLVDQQGNPIELAPGVNAGACAAQPTGTGAPYAQCGTAGTDACQADLDCMGVQGSTSGGCTPRCSAAAPTCPGAGTLAGQCVLSTDGVAADHCALICDTAAPACPTGMNCTTLGNGAICTWP